MEGEETQGEIVAVRHFGAVLYLPTVRPSFRIIPCVSPPCRRASRLAANPRALALLLRSRECVHVRPTAYGGQWGMEVHTYARYGVMG